MPLTPQTSPKLGEEGGFIKRLDPHKLVDLSGASPKNPQGGFSSIIA